MRLLMVADSLGMGGAERHVLGLAAALCGRGHDLTVLVSAGGPLEAEAEQAGVPVRIVCERPAKRVASPELAAAVRDEAAAWRPDLVHAHMFASAVAAMVAVAGRATPLVVTEHSEGAWRAPADVALSRLTYLAADAVIAVSQALADHIVAVDRVPAERVHLVPNTLLRLAPAGPCPPLDLDGGPAVGVVARLRPEKGLVPFLHAAAVVAAARPDARFVVAGDGPQEADLRALAAELALDGRVHFVGLCPDGAALLRQLDVAVLPSLANEGTPLVVLEAMAAGVPLVADDDRRHPRAGVPRSGGAAGGAGRRRWARRGDPAPARRPGPAPAAGRGGPRPLPRRLLARGHGDRHGGRLPDRPRARRRVVTGWARRQRVTARA